MDDCEELSLFDQRVNLVENFIEKIIADGVSTKVKIQLGNALYNFCVMNKYSEEVDKLVIIMLEEIN